VGVVPPYYYPHDDWEVYAHYKAIAKSVPGTPMFIYDNTETTWVEITPAKANKIIEAIAPNPLAGIKVSFIAYDKLLGYVYQLPRSVGVFPGGIFSLYTGYSIGVRGAIHPPSTPFPGTCVKMSCSEQLWRIRGIAPAPEPTIQSDTTLALTPALLPQERTPRTLCAHCALEPVCRGRARHSVRAVLEQPGKRRARSDAPYLSSWKGNSLRPRWDESLDGEVIRSAR